MASCRRVGRMVAGGSRASSPVSTRLRHSAAKASRAPKSVGVMVAGRRVEGLDGALAGQHLHALLGVVQGLATGLAEFHAASIELQGFLQTEFTALHALHQLFEFP